MKLLRFGKKRNKFFVLPSTFRTFAPKIVIFDKLWLIHV